MANKKFEELRNIETKKSAVSFDITTVLKDAVGAKAWKDKDGLWTLISSSMTDFSSKVFEKINNYAQNMIDIETCNPAALKSIASSVNLGQITEFIKDVYPEFINDLVNIFSIDYKLLLAPSKTEFKVENNTNISNLKFLSPGKFLSNAAITKYIGSIDIRNKHTFPSEAGYSTIFFNEILNNLDKLRYLLETENDINFNEAAWSYIDEQNRLEITSLSTKYLFLKDFSEKQSPTLNDIFDELKFYKKLYNSDVIQNKTSSIVLDTSTNDFTPIEIAAIYNYYNNQLGNKISYKFCKQTILEHCSKIYIAKDFNAYNDYYKTFGLSQNDHLNSILYYWTPYSADIINDANNYLLINNYNFTVDTKIINPFLVLIAILKNIAYDIKNEKIMKVSYTEKFTNVEVDLSNIILYALETIQKDEKSYYYSMLVFHFYGVLYDNIFNEYLKKEWSIKQNGSKTITNFVGSYSEYTKDEFIQLVQNDLSNSDLIEFIKNGPTLYNQYHVDFIKTINILNNIITYTDSNEYSKKKLSYYIPYYNNDFDLLQPESYLYDNKYYKYRQLLMGITYDFCTCDKPEISKYNNLVCTKCGKIISNGEQTKYKYTFNLANSYIYKAALIFADYCIKIKEARQTLKDLVQQYSRIGTAKLLNDIISDYFYKQFSKRNDWQLKDSAATYYDSLSSFDLFKNLAESNINGNNKIDISIVEYYDKTNYLNIYSTRNGYNFSVESQTASAIYETTSGILTTLLSGSNISSNFVDDPKYHYDETKIYDKTETIECSSVVSGVSSITKTEYLSTYQPDGTSPSTLEYDTIKSISTHVDYNTKVKDTVILTSLIINYDALTAVTTKIEKNVNFMKGEIQNQLDRKFKLPSNQAKKNESIPILQSNYFTSNLDFELYKVDYLSASVLSYDISDIQYAIYPPSARTETISTSISTLIISSVVTFIINNVLPSPYPTVITGHQKYDFNIPRYKCITSLSQSTITGLTTCISTYNLSVPIYKVADEYKSTTNINNNVNVDDTLSSYINTDTDTNSDTNNTLSSADYNYNKPFWDSTLTGTVETLTDEEILDQCKFFSNYFKELQNAVTDENKIAVFKYKIYPLLNTIWTIHANKAFIGDLSDLNNYYSGSSGRFQIENYENAVFPTIAPTEYITNLFYSTEINDYKSTYIIKNYYNSLNTFVSSLYTDFFDSTKIIKTDILREAIEFFSHPMLAIPTNTTNSEAENFHGYVSVMENNYHENNDLTKVDVDGPWKYSYLQKFIQTYIDPAATNLNTSISSLLTANYDFIMTNETVETFITDTRHNYQDLLSSETYLADCDMFNISNVKYNKLYDIYSNYISNTYDLLEFDITNNLDTEINRLMIFGNQILKLQEFKIFDYKQDIYNNHYFLFKHYKYNKYEDSGEIWVRYKNRPLAMPFMKAVNIPDASDSYYNISNIEFNRDLFLTEYDQVKCTHNTYTKIIKQMINNAISFNIFDNIVVLVGYSNFIKHNDVYENDLTYKYLKAVIFNIYEDNDQLYIDPTSIKFMSTHTDNDYLLNINEYVGSYFDDEETVTTVLYNINQNNINITDYKLKNGYTDQTFLLNVPLTFTYIKYNINTFLVDYQNKTYYNLKYPIIGLYKDNICIDTCPYISSTVGYQLKIASQDQSIWKVDTTVDNFAIGYESVSNDILQNKQNIKYGELYKHLYETNLAYLDILKVRCELIYKNINNTLLPVIDKINISLDKEYLKDEITYSELSGSGVELNAIHNMFPKCDVENHNELVTKLIPTKFGGIKSYADDITYDINGYDLIRNLVHCKESPVSGNGIKYAFSLMPTASNPDFKAGLYELVFDIINYNLIDKTNLNKDEVTVERVLNLIYQSDNTEDSHYANGLVINLDNANNYNKNSYKLTADILRFLPGIANCILDDMKIIINFGDLSDEIKNFLTGSESFDLDCSVYIDDAELNGTEHFKKVGWHCGYKYTDYIDWETNDDRQGGPEILTIHLKKYYNYLYNKYRNQNDYNKAIYLQQNFTRIVSDCKLVINVCWYNESRVISINPNIEIIWNGIYYKRVIPHSQMQMNTGCCENSFQDILHLDLLNNTFKFTEGKCYKIETIYNTGSNSMHESTSATTDVATYKYSVEYYKSLSELKEKVRHLTPATSTVIETDSYIEVCSQYGPYSTEFLRSWYIYDIDKLVTPFNGAYVQETDIVSYFKSCLTYWKTDNYDKYYATAFKSSFTDTVLTGIITDLEIFRDNYQYGYYFDNYLSLTEQYPSGNIFANIPTVYSKLQWNKIPLNVYCNNLDNNLILTEDMTSTLILYIENKFHNSVFYNENITGSLYTCIDDPSLSTYNTINFTKDKHLSGILSASNSNEDTIYTIELIPFYRIKDMTERFLTEYQYTFNWINYPKLIHYNFNNKNISVNVSGNNIDIYYTYFIGDTFIPALSNIVNINNLSAITSINDEKNTSAIYYNGKIVDLVNTYNVDSISTVTTSIISGEVISTVTVDRYVNVNDEYTYNTQIGLYKYQYSNSLSTLALVQVGNLNYNANYKAINFDRVIDTDISKVINYDDPKNTQINVDYNISIKEKTVNSYNNIIRTVKDWEFSDYTLSANLTELINKFNIKRI